MPAHPTPFTPPAVPLGEREEVVVGEGPVDVVGEMEGEDDTLREVESVGGTPLPVASLPREGDTLGEGLIEGEEERDEVLVGVEVTLEEALPDPIPVVVGDPPVTLGDSVSTPLAVPPP